MKEEYNHSINGKKSVQMLRYLKAVRNTYFNGSLYLRYRTYESPDSSASALTLLISLSINFFFSEVGAFWAVFVAAVFWVLQ